MRDHYKQFYKLSYFLIFVVFLWGQWAMWSNPSLPVGSSDQGIGLGAGDIMLGADYNYQFIDWQHDPTPDEKFHHLGTLSASILSVGMTAWPYWLVEYFLKPNTG